MYRNNRISNTWQFDEYTSGNKVQSGEPTAYFLEQQYLAREICQALDDHCDETDHIQHFRCLGSITRHQNDIENGEACSLELVGTLVRACSTLQGTLSIALNASLYPTSVISCRLKAVWIHFFKNMQWDMLLPLVLAALVARWLPGLEGTTYEQAITREPEYIIFLPAS